MAVPSIQRGKILAYRVFDAGATIALDVADRRIPRAKRLELGGPQIEGLVIAVRPLEIDLGTCEVSIARRKEKVEAHCTAHVFDFGAISIVYELPIEPGTTLEELTPVCDGLYDSPELDARGVEHRGEVMKLLGDAVEGAHGWTEAETYTITFVEELHGATIREVAKSQAAAKLLVGETSDKPLGDALCDDVLRHAFSYFADDLVVLDWNSALVVEPTGTRIVCHVLELATCQLLEFRYYDGLLDRELEGLYDYVERTRPRIVKSPFGALRRDVLRRFMELTEFTERVDNAIKWVGDFYLARVYLAAITRFRVPEWRESVESKLRLVSRAYELLKGDVEVSRTQLLELTVVLLILVEILTALQRH